MYTWVHLHLLMFTFVHLCLFMFTCICLCAQFVFLCTLSCCIMCIDFTFVCSNAHFMFVSCRRKQLVTRRASSLDLRFTQLSSKRSLRRSMRILNLRQSRRCLKINTKPYRSLRRWEIHFFVILLSLCSGKLQKVVLNFCFENLLQKLFV